MARAHLYLPVTTAAGNIIEGITVRLLQPTTTSLIAGEVYTSAAGDAIYSQPFIVANGVIDVYLANPGRLRLGITPPGQSEFFLDDVDAGYDAGLVVITTTPLRVTNTPTAAGDRLAAVDSANAQWIPAAESDSAHVGAAANTIALGSAAAATTPGDVALGTSAVAEGGSATALGALANAKYDSTVALGHAAKTRNIDAVAIGHNTLAYSSSVAIGMNASDGSLAQDVVANPNYSNLILGHGAAVERNVSSSIALGHEARVSGYFSNTSTTPPTDTYVPLQNSTALGAGAQALHPNSTAIGTGATTTTNRQLMLGTALDVVEVRGAFVLRSPNGNRWTVSVDNNGALSTSPA